MYTTKIGYLIKLPTVIQLTGNSRSKIYADVKDGIFPAPLKTGKRSVAWKFSDIENWINSLQTNLVKNGGHHDSK